MLLTFKHHSDFVLFFSIFVFLFFFMCRGELPTLWHSHPTLSDGPWVPLEQPLHFLKILVSQIYSTMSPPGMNPYVFLAIQIHHLNSLQFIIHV